MKESGNMLLLNTPAKLITTCALKYSKVLATIPHYYKRKIREALEIEKIVNNINRDDGLKLREAWKPIVQLIKNNWTFNK
jgi:hypothetical protein